MRTSNQLDSWSYIATKEEGRTAEGRFNPLVLMGSLRYLFLELSGRDAEECQKEVEIVVPALSWPEVENYGDSTAYGCTSLGRCQRYCSGKQP